MYLFVSETGSAEQTDAEWIESRCEGREISVPDIPSVADGTVALRGRLQLRRSYAGGSRNGTVVYFAKVCASITLITHNVVIQLVLADYSFHVG